MSDVIDMSARKNMEIIYPTEKTRFLAEVDDKGHYVFENSAIVRIIDQINDMDKWLGKSQKYFVEDCSINDLTREKLDYNVVPIGSLDFVNKALGLLEHKPIKPLNIPECLRDFHFLGRNVAITKNLKERRKFCKEHSLDKIFIKSNSEVKKFYADVYPANFEEFSDEECFISEPVDFISEWRCFVYRGKLRGIKHYLGNEWIMPYKFFIEDCINQIGDSIIAYTLDVGITKNCCNAVIEVQNFISCGLYGFEDEIMIPMLINAYKEELSK